MAYGVTVVIPTYNRENVLKECIKSLFNQTYPNDKYEIIIVDGSSTDGTEELLKEYSKKAPCKMRWFIKKSNISEARNLGIKESLGEIVCFTDDDCVADKHWLENIVVHFSDKKIGGVGGKIIGYKSTGVIEKYGDYQFRQKVVKNNYIDASIMTANAAYRKSILKKINGFDPNFRVLEDTDLGIRVMSMGYLLKYAPDAIVYHKHRNTLLGILKRAYRYAAYGTRRICDKYPEKYPIQKIILLYFLRIGYLIITYPLILIRAPFEEDKLIFVAKPILDILITFSRIIGIVKSLLFDKKIKSNDKWK
jgi:GT2 family glycosyltransferase